MAEQVVRTALTPSMRQKTATVQIVGTTIRLMIFRFKGSPSLVAEWLVERAVALLEDHKKTNV